jgi:HEPN domain-containing protein
MSQNENPPRLFRRRATWWKEKIRKPIRIEVKEDHIDVYTPDDSELEHEYILVRMIDGSEFAVAVDEAAKVKHEAFRDGTLYIFLAATNYFRTHQLIHSALDYDLNRLVQGGYALPTAVLSAFASELLLKCIICIETGKAPHGHPLKALFDQLSPTSRTELQRLWDEYAQQRAEEWGYLEKRYGHEIPRTLSEALTAGSNAFEVLRYGHHERPKKSFTGYGLDDLPHLLGQRVLQLRPEWRDLPWEGKDLYFDSETNGEANADQTECGSRNVEWHP